MLEFVFNYYLICNSLTSVLLSPFFCSTHIFLFHLIFRRALSLHFFCIKMGVSLFDWETPIYFCINNCNVTNQKAFSRYRRENAQFKNYSKVSSCISLKLISNSSASSVETIERL